MPDITITLTQAEMHGHLTGDSDVAAKALTNAIRLVSGALATIKAAIFAPELEEPQLVDIPAPGGEISLRVIRSFVGGGVDIGVSRPNQFAVYERSASRQPANRAASEFFGRPLFGVVVAWGVTEDGRDADFEPAP